jgi:hypothetical protein
MTVRTPTTPTRATSDLPDQGRMASLT